MNNNRRSIRLKNYDYTQNGAYFITICTQNRKRVFGEIIDQKMCLNDTGRFVEKWWLKLPDRFSNIQLDAHIIMPDHIHGIIVIYDPVVGAPLVGALGGVRNGTHNVVGVAHNTVGVAHNTADDHIRSRVGTRPTPTIHTSNVTHTIGEIIGAFKSITTNEYIRNIKNHNLPPFNRRLWQRNYYERIIRNEFGLDACRSYIIYNPINWGM